MATTPLAPFTGRNGRLVHLEISDRGTVFTRTGGGALTKVKGVTARNAAHAGEIARSKHGEQRRR
jgi:hypothetical protein